MAQTTIALIGLSGSGKSNVGIALARKLDWIFIDSDREIEKRTELSVAQIFQTLGEPFFRERENELVCSLKERSIPLSKKGLVLSTGGGLPIFNDNLSLLESFATLVYLHAPLEVLVTRIKQGEERPLLANADGLSSAALDEQLMQRLGKQIAERESIYARARYKIDTSSASPEQLADDIIRLTGLVSPSS